MGEQYPEILDTVHVAEMLGMSVTAVGEKLSRVRNILRKMLKDRIGPEGQR